MPGNSVRPFTPPKAVPRQTRPVTNWNLHLPVNLTTRQPAGETHGRVEISFPAAATPMIVETPHPLWHASRAARMTSTCYGVVFTVKSLSRFPSRLTFPVASNV